MPTKKQIELVKTRGQQWKLRKRGKICIDREILNSIAFMQLRATADAQRCYLQFLMKCKVEKLKTKAGRSKEWFISNNGEIQFSYKEAKEKGFNHFSRVIDQLVKNGFIDIAYQGSGLKGDVSLYSISERWRLYGTSEFETAERPKRNACYGFTKPKRVKVKKKISTPILAVT